MQSIPALHWQDRNDMVQSGFLWNLPQMELVAVDLFFGLGSVRKNLSSNCVMMIARVLCQKRENLQGKEYMRPNERKPADSHRRLYRLTACCCILIAFHRFP